MVDYRTQKTAILIISLLIFASAASHARAAQKATPLTIAYSAISYDQLPAWIAKETGLFAKNDLEVQLVYFTGGTTAAMALVSGDVAIAQNAGPEIVNAYMAGSDQFLSREEPSRLIG